MEHGPFIDDFPSYKPQFIRDFPWLYLGFIDDDFPGFIDDFPGFIDDFPGFIDDFPGFIDDFPGFIDDFPGFIDDFPIK